MNEAYEMNDPKITLIDDDANDKCLHRLTSNNG